jgi:acyl-CoA synthetase (AMP-forming)/AMP-acid ligase II
MRAVCVGAPVAGTTVAIADEAGRLVGERAVGEVLVKGPSLMDGYFRDERASAEALRGGWLHTGDLGFLDAGRLYVVGRAKDLVIKAGRNLHPSDIERIVGELDGLRAGGVAAFGRMNEVTGTDDLVVVAETAASEPAERERIVKAIRGEVLAVLGVGVDEVRLKALGSIPRTTSGKVRRRECARLLAGEEAG